MRSANGDFASRLPAAEVGRLIESGVIEGGMIPKVQACLTAAQAGCECAIVDGRVVQALLGAVEGRISGTIVG